MNREEAIESLRKAATRKHEVSWSTMGPSHGDPGGYRFIHRACAAVKHTMFEIESIDESKCNCRAHHHNQLVEEAIQILTSTTPEP